MENTNQDGKKVSRKRSQKTLQNNKRPVALTEKPNIHFTHNYLLQPTNSIIVNLIGVGGTGSHMLQALAKMNHALVALEHAGLMIYAYDDDRVTEANIGRQLFSSCDIGQNKAAVLVNRINRACGTTFQAIPYKYCKQKNNRMPFNGSANITISCVDTVVARFEIAEILSSFANKNELAKPLYWLDLGNTKKSGQAILSTIGKHKQPQSKKYNTVSELPFITNQYSDLLSEADSDNTPSCSLAEALNKQDLFINPSLVNPAASLIWNMFREGMTAYKGFFMNLKDYRTIPIPV